MYEEDDDARLAHYISIGAIEFVGMDSTGEAIYQINDIAKEIAPELWKSHKEFIDQNLLNLFEKGLLEVEYNEDLEATFNISEEGMKLMKEIGMIDPDFDE